MSEIENLYDILRYAGLSEERVVLVGGLAIDIYTGIPVSKDVDFVVMIEDYDRIPAVDMWEGVKQMEYMGRRVDFLAPDSYVVGQYKGNDLIEYIKRHRSFKVDGIYVAKPEVVFYTRLVIPNWGNYIRKDIRDLNRGLPGEKDKIYAGVKAIADLFGTRCLVDEHLKLLDEYVQSNFPERI